MCIAPLLCTSTVDFDDKAYFLLRGLPPLQNLSCVTALFHICQTVSRTLWLAVDALKCIICPLVYEGARSILGKTINRSRSLTGVMTGKEFTHLQVWYPQGPITSISIRCPTCYPCLSDFRFVFLR